MAVFTGTPEDNLIDGTDGADSFFLQQGGADDARGNGGADGFYFGSMLTSSDKVDGGTGRDSLAVQGNYPSLTLGDIWHVEALVLVSGTNSSFGDSANNRYDYNVTLTDANIAAGETLIVQGKDLLPDEDLVLNASAETDGHLRVFAGQGNDTLTGGAGDDGFFFGSDGNFTSADRVHGGDGTDSIAFRGNYSLVMQAAAFSGIEALVFLTGKARPYGGPIVAEGFDYSIETADANVAAGSQLLVIGTTLQAGESLNFDGRAETDGTFRILAGTGADVLYGGQGDDVIFGQSGDDILLGEAGNDTLTAGPGIDAAYGGAGFDIIDFDGFLTSEDIVDGGANNDTLVLGHRDYADADLAGVTSVEALALETFGHSYVLGANAQAAGLIIVNDLSAGANVIDVSGISRSGFFSITGGAGGDTISVADVQQNTLIYYNLTDSSGSGQDTITNFRSGMDRISVQFVDVPFVGQIEFKGNFAGHLAAQSALDPGDSNVDAVFDSSSHTLWFNLNDDGILDDNDLSIVLAGVSSLQGSDVLDGAFMM